MTMSSDDLLPNTSDHHHVSAPVDVNDPPPPPPVPFKPDSPPPLSVPGQGGLSPVDDVPLAMNAQHDHHLGDHTSLKRALEPGGDDDDDDDDDRDDDQSIGDEFSANADGGGQNKRPKVMVKKVKKIKKFKKKRSHDSSGSAPRVAPLFAMSSSGNPPSWNDMFFALMAFKAKLGHWNVPSQTKLGKWVSKQRQEYSKIQRSKVQVWQCAELSEERMEVLDSLGFIWDMNQHEMDRRWHERFEQLRKWKEENGHCNVPQRTALGQWVKIQRENKRESDLKETGQLPARTKQKPCLAPDRIDKLNSIGFQWRVAGPVTGWDNRYKQLVDYAKEHNGDVNVPQYYPPDKSFGRWVMKQRCEYSLKIRGMKSQLTQERVDNLNAIGFSWVAPNFKRKVGIGIDPGSAAAQVASQQESAMNTHSLLPPAADGTAGQHQDPMQPIPPQPLPIPMIGDPQQQQYLPQQPYDPHPVSLPGMVTHQEFAPLDPPQHQHYQQQHAMHHTPPPDPQSHGQQQAPHDPSQHGTVEEVVAMVFL